MQKTFTLNQVKKLIFTTAGISILATWCLASYAIPKIEANSLEARMQSNTKAIIGDGEIH
jgi:uncharacterized membrane protein (Fun14 family)